MTNKLIIHIVSLVVGICSGLYSTHFPILPSIIHEANNSGNYVKYWTFMFQKYWWLMLLLFIIGYGLTFLTLFLINKKLNKKK